MINKITILLIFLVSITTANALTADIEGNLTADANTFFVDSLNNRVGVGTATPRTPMEIQAAIESDHYGQLIVRDSAALAADIGGQINFGGAYKTDGTKTTWAGIKGGKNNANNEDLSGYLTFWTRHTGSSITERMRIDSLGTIWIGSVQDTNLYRSNASVLKTDDTFSALDLVDRTPYYEDGSKAIEELSKIKANAEGEIDHSTLPDFVKVAVKEDEVTGEIEYGRSLSGTVSMLTAAVIELKKENEDLKARIEALEAK